MSAFAPPPPSSLPPDSEPGPAPSLPGVGLWPDSDVSEVGPTASRPALVAPLAAPAAEPTTTIGHIGRYALKSLVGEGGLGTVYSAQDPLLSRTIAIKTLNLQISAEEREAFNALFLNEARAAGGLSHPNIVTVFDAGISDNRAYIAMELLKGRDLRQLRQEGWRPTPAQAALIARRVADALAYAHSKGVVHCDVKPANIFMVGRTQPRVLDFGIARIAHRHDAGSAAALAAGSPYYMSPEQVHGKPIDRRSDVFSLGVVLYEMLTDVKPFRGSSLEQITAAVVGHQPPLASDVDPNVPRELAEIAARAMEKDPQQRLRSARALSRDLRHWLEEHALGGEVPAPVLVRQAPRRAWLAAAVVAGAMFGGGAIWALVSPAAAPEPAVAVAPPTPTPTPTPTPAPAAAAPDQAPPAMPSAEAAAAATSAAPDTTAATAAAPTTPAAVEATPAAPAAVAPAAAVADAVPVAAAPIAPIAPAVAPPGPPTATTTAPVAIAAAPAPAQAQPGRERRPRDAAPREIRPNAAAALPATGLLRLAIVPGGQVEIDGAAAGTTPPLAELSLSEGRHQITVRNGDFAPFTATVVVTAREAVTLRHRFGP